MSGYTTSDLCDVPLNYQGKSTAAMAVHDNDATQGLVDHYFSNEPRETQLKVASVLHEYGSQLFPVNRNKEDTVRFCRRVAKHFIANNENRNKYNDLEPFYVIDLGKVMVQYARFRKSLPTVRPHFAVKCNPNLALMRVIAAMGGGFDCASQREIQMVLDNGLGTPKDIIFANPCKMPHDLQYARSVGVNCVTFDSTNELEKLAEYLPDAEAVLRIKTNDSAAQCAFSTKFGASMSDAQKLLERAMELQVDVVGVSFHVGSGNNDPSAYTGSIRDARRVFDMAIELGFKNMRLLDLGGGYPGTAPPLDADGNPKSLCFEEIASAMRPVLDESFGDLDVTIIAEPGRYFTAASHMLAINVFGARRVPLQPHEYRDLRHYLDGSRAEPTATGPDASALTSEFAGDAADVEYTEKEEYQYYVTDGLYNSFNCIIFDHAHPELYIVDEDDEDDEDEPEEAEEVVSMARRPDAHFSKSERHALPPLSASAGRGGLATAPRAKSALATTLPLAHMNAFPRQSHTDPCDSSVDPAAANALPMRPSGHEQELKHRQLRITTIFGPTCDSFDVILKKQVCPELFIGDWLFFPNMGSYTTAAGCAFNGFSTRRIEYICSPTLPEEMTDLLCRASAGIPISLNPAQLLVPQGDSVELEKGVMGAMSHHGGGDTAAAHSSSMAESYGTNGAGAGIMCFSDTPRCFVSNKLPLATSVPSAHRSEPDDESYMV